MTRDDLQTRLGIRIKDLRSRYDYSQEQFANHINMDRSYFASIEVGRRNVTLINLAKIANGFDITLSELFDGIAIPDDFDQPRVEYGSTKLPSRITGQTAPKAK